MATIPYGIQAISTHIDMMYYGGFQFSNIIRNILHLELEGVDGMIDEIVRMHKAHDYDIEKLNNYYLESIRTDVVNVKDQWKLADKLTEIGYPLRFYAKGYHCLIALFSEGYLQIHRYSTDYYLMMAMLSKHNEVLPEHHAKTERFFNIASKLNTDMQQKLSNVVANLSKDYISNVTYDDFEKWLGSKSSEK